LITALVLFAAVLVDRLLGEPPRWHPLAGFGRWAAWLEARIHGDSDRSPSSLRWRGVLALLAAVVPLVLLAWLLSSAGPLGFVFDILLLYLALGATSLEDHARAVQNTLRRGDLAQARDRVRFLVSRDTKDMDFTAVARATVESVLENGCDAVFATLFWFLAAGIPGVVAYRLVNTLDAMWGYRTPRYEHFGWAAARLDDLMNWIPARLTALTYSLLGSAPSALRCWARQAVAWESPNAGPVMAAGAGALGVLLGGEADYHGERKSRPLLGFGPAPTGNDIGRSIRLVRRGLMLWVAVVLIGGLAVA